MDLQWWIATIGIPLVGARRRVAGYRAPQRRLDGRGSGGSRKPSLGMGLDQGGPRPLECASGADENGYKIDIHSGSVEGQGAWPSD
jgi:hypothetical protein